MRRSTVVVWIQGKEGKGEFIEYFQMEGASRQENLLFKNYNISSSDWVAVCSSFSHSCEDAHRFKQAHSSNGDSIDFVQSSTKPSRF